MQKDVGRMFGGRRERGVPTKLKTENQARRFWLVKGEYIRNLTNIWLYWWGEGIWQQLLYQRLKSFFFSVLR